MKTRDEITAARKRRRRKYQLRRLLVFVIAIAVALGIILLISRVDMFTFRGIGDFFQTTFAKRPGYPVLLDGSKPLRVVPISNANAVLTDSELIVKGNGGGELLRSSHSFQSPDIRGAGSRILLFDRGNRSFSVYNRTGMLFSDESEYSIISADIASDGTVIILTRGDSSMSQIKVLTGSNYTTLFTWFGAKGAPYSCGISDNGNEIYFTGLVPAEGGLKTVFTVIDVGKREQRSEREVRGIIKKVYQNGAKYTLVGDEAVYLLNSNLEIEAEYPLTIVPSIRVSKENGPLAIAFGDNHQSDLNYILILSDRLEEVSKIEGVGPVEDMYMASDRLYVLSGNTVYAMQTDGTIVETYETDIKAIRVFVIGGKLSVLLPDRIEQPQKIKQQTN